MHLAGLSLKGAAENNCGGGKGLLHGFGLLATGCHNRHSRYALRLLTALQAVLIVRRPRGRPAKVESGFAGRGPARADGVDSVNACSELVSL
jgi:hypothetical protein